MTHKNSCIYIHDTHPQLMYIYTWVFMSHKNSDCIYIHDHFHICHIITTKFVVLAKLMCHMTTIFVIQNHWMSAIQWFWMKSCVTWQPFSYVSVIQNHWMSVIQIHVTNILLYLWHIWIFHSHLSHVNHICMCMYVCICMYVCVRRTYTVAHIHTCTHSYVSHVNHMCHTVDMCHMTQQVKQHMSEYLWMSHVPCQPHLSHGSEWQMSWNMDKNVKFRWVREI